MKRGSLFIILLVSLIRCSDEDSISSDIGLDYFPLRTGDSWIYEVEETSINQSITASTTYELRVTVIDSLKNSEGGYTYTFQRARRLTEMDSWENIETWTALISKNQLIQSEGNVLFIKLLFPLSAGSKWNGNQYNNLPNNGNLFDGMDGEFYHVPEFNLPITLSTGLNFGASLAAYHNDFIDPIVGKDFRKEVYARDVGLVYKEITQLEYCTVGDCLGQQKVDKGFMLVQTLKSYASQ